MGRSRDPRNALAFEEDAVIRQFDEEGAFEFRTVEATGLLSRLIDDGLAVPYSWVGHSAIRSPRLSPITYPAEWPTPALADAALLTLRVARRAWDAGLHMRDASAYNVVFSRGRPMLVDLGSFGTGHTGTWTAYGQFCDHFLSPLMLARHRGLAHGPLYGDDGIDLVLAASALRGWDRFHRGVRRHVVWRDRLERQSRGMSAEARMQLRRDVRLPEEVVARSLDRMVTLVESLVADQVSDWSSYEDTNVYSEEQAAARDEFIGRTLSTHRGGMAIDVGCNTGRHSAVLAQIFDDVVSIDADPVSVGIVYERVRAGGLPNNMTPVVSDIVSPFAGGGFMGRERLGLLERLDGAEVGVWMAVIHHLVIGAGMSIGQFLSLLEALAPRHVVEFIEPSDPMVELLSAAKGGVHHAYSRQIFEQELGRAFRLEQAMEVSDTRILYAATTR